ncbi:hypothetical protein [Vibrio phage MZH0603]|nr:hypothetical protein [Vibrio phage MZH0603]
MSEHYSILDWLSVCPKCWGDEVRVEGASTVLVTQGQKCTCINCGHSGEVVVYGPEECDVEWGD